MNIKNVKPNYDNSILGIPNAILKHYGINPHHTPLSKISASLSSKPKNVVLMVLDGLGTEVMDYHLGSDAFLQKNKVDDISSVFPSTTTSATTSLRTGLSPAEHGWLAWSCYFKEFDKVIELYTNKDFYSQKVVQDEHIAFNLLKFTTINEKISTVTSDTIKTWEIMPAFIPNGHKTFESAAQKLKELCNNDENNFIYFYWNAPDSIMHEHGCHCKKVNQNIHKLNDVIEATAKELGDTLLIITADHGHLDVSKYILLNDYPEIEKCFKTPPSMEARVVSFNIKDDMHEQFVTEFNKIFSDEYVLVSKSEYIENFLGGGTPHPRTNDFVGDFVAFSCGTSALSYEHDGNKPEDIKGLHGSITRPEMIVPLIMLNCRQR